jgi:NAD(P)-dependent dehydrogenase (short-subunit alcohol dehydrogenase family)
MYKELFSLVNKKALVIGAASGIGKAIAQGFKEFGAYVIAADINVEGIKDGDEKYYVDITNLDSIKQLLKNIDVLHVLVITPAINYRKRIEEYTYEEFKRVIDINMIGTFMTIKEAIPLLKRANGSSVIILSSIRSVIVEPGQGPYAMTKAALVQLTKTLAVELAPYNVRVNAIAPGVVDTPLTEPIKKRPVWYKAYAERNALKRWAKPEEIVGPAILLASDAGSYITGTVLFVDGGWTAIDGRFDPFETREL